MLAFRPLAACSAAGEHDWVTTVEAPARRAAKTSKERVYAYFRSKEELYAAVAADQLREVMDSAALPSAPPA